MKLKLAVAAMAVLASCAPSPVPWDSDLPPGGEVIYHADHGEGICAGFTSCATRIVRVDGVCITETYRDGAGWEFRESDPCVEPEG